MSVMCKAIPFLCNNSQCSCYSQHKICTTTLAWECLRQSFLNKLKNSSLYDKYLIQINDLYKWVIKQIEKSFTYMKNISDSFGFSQLERKVYQKFRQKKFCDLTGQLISKVETELMQDKRQFQVWSIDQEKKEIQKQTMTLVQTLQRLIKVNSFKLDSKITQDVITLSSFFPNKIILGMNLLYRASENNFQASKFHEKCDGKQHTITIIKTEFGNIIGGYTPLPWNKSKHNQRQGDSSRQSFIFSLTNKHKLNLIKGKQQYAIYHNSNIGPAFGEGCDLTIWDKSNENTYSYAQPEHAYDYNNDQIKGTQQIYRRFSGQSIGEYFRIQEWQVYSIVFA